MQCVTCQQPMRGPIQGYWYRCETCDYLASDLQPDMGTGPTDRPVDEARRRKALEALRLANFETVLDVLAPLKPPAGMRLLDVGCAHGWFLDAAAARGFNVLGIEPNPKIAAFAAAKGHRVLAGYFPDVLENTQGFDVVTFHDVFEHLTAPRDAARAIRACLQPGGLVVMNLPSSRGALFRLATLLARLGLHGPLDRLWQRGFLSPHLSYFSPESLARLMKAIGMKEVFRGALPSVSRTGLWARLRYDRRAPLLVSALLWPPLFLFSCVSALLPADISLQIFQRPGH